jgi:uncharacterized membrane protein (DUF106 family)
MRQNRSINQGNLFEQPQLEILKMQVKDLDRNISKALKKGDFQTAKKLTEQQAELLNKLLELGDSNQKTLLA